MAEQLRRRIGLGLLTAYGVGVMIGAGIYVLIGAVAAKAGIWAPMSFLLAGIVAAPTALSYAEFSSRIPDAAGEAAYVESGSGRRWLGVLVGLAIVIAGTISAAAVLRGGAGYLSVATGLDPMVGMIGLGAALTLVAAVGVLESLSLAALFTAIEVLGLALVLWAGWQAPVSVDFASMSTPAIPSAIAAAAVLAFFAFIGFEDIVNMAEEVKDPERTLPRAILFALVITTIIYALVCYAAVRTVPIGALASSEQPLALVWEYGTGKTASFLSLIAVFAAANGILAQIVMAARVLFGLGKRSAGLAVFHHAHPRFGTPMLATIGLGAAVIVTAIALPVSVLAGMTSSVLLSVFVLVNLSLLLVKRSGAAPAFSVPAFVPATGLVLSLAALAIAAMEALS
ncbi:APC family permease [Pseudoprimorskyibacter insulae]|uniref:Putative amino acid permease YhdG n=1 Tax=Pseudoprimorskyibacter insulae TaxID=1695997 RepID=A0A2R8AWE9_9RHOB|nr:APC family permease [Pseudoprimorskyibacter insulae]SPF80353.1 putative amino acid permease YhdG [Pseudoprimorskyibacter insulae]